MTDEEIDTLIKIAWGPRFSVPYKQEIELIRKAVVYILDHREAKNAGR